MQAGPGLRGRAIRPRAADRRAAAGDPPVRGSRDAVRHARAPADPGADGHRAGRRADRRAGARVAVAENRRGAQPARVARVRAGGRRLQHQFAQKARRDPVRQAGPDDRNAAADVEDESAFDRVRGAGGARRGARAAAPGARMARADEAEGHLHRRAAPARPPRHRARPHLLQSGGRGNGPVEQQRPESAEHPDPHRARPADPRGRSSPIPDTS